MDSAKVELLRSLQAGIDQLRLLLSMGAHDPSQEERLVAGLAKMEEAEAVLLKEIAAARQP